MSIEVTNINKTFGTFRALDDVSLHVQSGELVALLGPSGSGKTTLLRIIAGLEHADRGSGSIRFHEEDVHGRHVGEREVGFVFQHYALFRHMTVFQNVAFGMKVRPRRRRPSKAQIHKKVQELLDLVQLGNLAKRYPHQLSGGQRQRIALARALAVEPKVLLLDEPFGALDAKVRLELRQWLRRLHDEIHMTSVFVTHDQDEALELSDRVVVMNHGRIEQIGTPDEIFHNPQTEFVMNFLGQVNVFHGRVDRGKVSFEQISLEAPEQADAPSGSKARVFIRPHDVTIDTKPNGMPAIPATVLRVHSAGSIVQVQLRTDAGQTLLAELSQDRFKTMTLDPGTSVYVRPRHIRVFSELTDPVV